MSLFSRRPARVTLARNPRRAIFLEPLETRCVMAVGDLDTTFGGGGRVTADFGDFTSFVGSSDEAYTVEVQAADSKVVVGGSSGLFGPSQGTLARYLPSGALDPSFGIGGRVSTGVLTAINDIYLLPSGKILAVGPTTTSTPSGTVDFGVIQYLPDGQVDEDGFGSRGLSVIDLVGADIANAVTVSGGKILVAGSSGGGVDFGVVRLNLSGNLDNTFDVDGKVLVDFGSADEAANDVGVDSAGRIVLAGYAGTGVGATRDFALARLDTNGTLDATFNLDGLVTTDFNQDRDDGAKSLVIQAGDNYVVGGTALQAKMFGTDYDFALARYAPNGDLLGGFDGDGKRTIDFTRDTTQPSFDQLGQIKAAPSGQIVAVGRAWEPTTPRHDVAMVRLDGVTGVIDSSLDLANGGLLFPQFWGLGDNAANAVAIAPTGYILAGITGGPPANYGLLSISTTGTPVASFGNNGRVVGDFTEFVGTSDLGEALAVQADGKTIVGGSVTGLSGPYGALARYNVNGTLDTTFGNGGRLVIPALNTVHDLVVLPSGKIVAVGGSSNMTAVQLLSDGSLDINNFGSQGVATIVFSGSSTARAVALQGTKLVLVGDVAVGGGDFGAARLTAAGNLDPTFDVDGRLTITFGGLADSAHDVVIDPQNRILIVGSATDTFYGTTDFALARVDNSGTLDATFNTDGKVTTDFNQNRDDVAESVALQGNNIVVGGSAHQLKVVAPSDLDFALARYGSNGDLLLGFGTGGKVTTDFTRDTTAPSTDTIGEIAVDANNNVVAVGRSWETVFGGRQKAAAARYNGVTGVIDTTLAPVTGGRLYPVFYGMGPDQLNALAIASNGDWIAAGTTGFGANFGVLRMNSSGVPLASFGANGRQVTDFTYFLGSDDEARAVIETGGKTLVAGFATGALGTQAAFARYLADGTLDPTFGIGGRITTNLINGATDIVLSGGKIIAIGPTAFGPSGTGTNYGVIQLNDDGSLDQLNFGSRGIAAIDFVGLTDSPEGVTVDDLGRIVVGGWTQVSTLPVDYDFSALRLTSTGNLDPTFDNDGRVLINFGSLNDKAYDVQLDSQGRIVLAGSAAVGVGSTLDFALARLEDTGVLDATFNLDGLVTTEYGQNRDNEIRRIAIEADDKIIAGGFASLQKVFPVAPDDDFALARYGVNGDLLGGFGNGGKQTTDFTRVTTTPSTDRIGDLKLTGDGTTVVVVGWSWETTPTRRDVAVASYNTTSGAILTSVNPATGGRLYPPYFGVSSDMGNALDIDASGDWILAGRTNDLTGNFGVQKLDGNGISTPPAPLTPDTAYEIVLLNSANAVITPNGLGQYVLGPGATFTVQVFVDDRRASGATGGVSAGYVDLAYAGDLADWTSAALTYGASYPNSHRGVINESLGRVEEAGAFGGAAPLGADPDRLLFSVQGKVKNSVADGSTFVIATDPAEDVGNETLMYGFGGPVPIANILYTQVTVKVSAGWHNAGLAGDVNNDGVVSNLDVQLIYDQLNNGNAPRALTGPPDAFYGDPNPTPAIPGSARYWDVDGNGVLNGADAAQVLFLMANPLTLAAAAPTSAPLKTITVAEAQAAVDGVIARLEAAGASAEQVSILKGATVGVTNLSAGLLGLQAGNSILFDDDAAGQGWFVDSTPDDDSEFVAGRAVDALFANGAVDLLTVAAHELGHALGLEHRHDEDAENVMEETLPVGTRRLPEGLIR